MMRVLLTGAGGSVGIMTLKALLEDDHQVTVFDVLNFKNKRRLSPYLTKVNVIWGDISDQVILDKIIKDQEVIIHLAAIIPPKADIYPDLAKKVNYHGTLKLIQAIKKQSVPPYLIFASSISIYGDRTENYWITVNDELKASVGDHYAKLKILTEAKIKEANIDHVIIRLTAIMDRPKIDPLMFHMPLRTKMEIATSKDTGYAFAQMLKYLNILNNNIYNLGGGKHCRVEYEVFLRKMLDIYGFDTSILDPLCFATQNFHCGYYLDGDILNDILDFQRDKIEDYYQNVEDQTSFIIKIINRLLGGFILDHMQKNAHPYQALKNNDREAIRRFFGGAR